MRTGIILLLIGVWSIGISQTENKNYIGDALVTADSIYYRWYPKDFSTAEGLLFLRSGYDRHTANQLGMFKARENPQTLDSITVPGSSGITISVDGSQITPLSPIELTGLSSDGNASLKWPARDLQQDYSAYWIERSVDSVHFRRLNSVPYVFVHTQFESNKRHAFRTDSTVQEGNTYHYRLIGITHFTTLGDTSNVISIKIPRKIRSMVNIDTIIRKDSLLQVHIGWHPQKPDQQFSFKLFQSQKPFGSRRLIASSSQPEINVHSSHRISGAYFHVTAHTETDSVMSYPYYHFERDQTPPEKPVGLHGEIDSAGIVRLKWNVSIADTLLGYKVFRANNESGEFVEITRAFAHDHFIDTLPLNTLTTHIYYRISAIDLNYNNSLLSDPLHLIKPDTIAPAPPTFIPGDSVMRWVNSPSQDLYRSCLLRKDGSMSDTLLCWQGDRTTFKDTISDSNGREIYYLIAIDHSGNTSSSKPYLKWNTDTHPHRPIIECQPDRKNKVINITWDLREKDVYSVLVYKRKNNETYFLLKRVDHAGEFQDKNVQINNSYTYKVQFSYIDGHKSSWSRPVEVFY